MAEADVKKEEKEKKKKEKKVGDGQRRVERRLSV